KYTAPTASSSPGSSLTSYTTAQQNTRLMHRFGACLAVGAMLLAFTTAPLFHVHDGDDHGNPGFVHAHFVEPEIPLSNSEHAVEKHHSHEHVRGFDVFTLNPPAAVFSMQAELSDKLRLPSLEVTDGVVPIEAPRAHGPPGGGRSVPRSPPAR